MLDEGDLNSYTIIPILPSLTRTSWHLSTPRYLWMKEAPVKTYFLYVEECFISIGFQLIRFYFIFWSRVIFVFCIFYVT